MNFLMRISSSSRITPVSPIHFSDKKSVKKINFLFSCLHAVSEEEELRQMFERWMVKYRTSYIDVSVKEKHFETFKKNKKMIEKHNSDPRFSYKLGVNQFADLSQEDIHEIYGNGAYDRHWVRFVKNNRRRMHHDDLGDELDSTRLENPINRRRIVHHDIPCDDEMDWRNYINPSKLWNMMFFGVFGSSGNKED